MGCTGKQGVHRRRLRGCTRRDQAATPSVDLVDRNFRPDVPDRLYVADITQHRTGQGWYYLAVVRTASAAASSAGRWRTTCAANSRQPAEGRASTLQISGGLRGCVLMQRNTVPCSSAGSGIDRSESGNTAWSASRAAAAYP